MIRLPQIPLLLVAVTFLSTRVCALDIAELLPQNTVAYLALPNALDFKSKLFLTQIGKLWDGPQMAVFRKEITASGFSAELKQNYGLDHRQLFEAAAGQWVASASVTKSGELSFCFFIEVKDTATGEAFVASATQELIGRGGKIVSVELPLAAKVISIGKQPSGNAEHVIFVIRENHLMIAGDADVVREIGNCWLKPQSGKSLAEREAYVKTKLQIAGDTTPIASMFFDPIAFAVAAEKSDTMRKKAKTSSKPSASSKRQPAIDPSLPPFPLRHGFPGINGIAGNLWANHASFELFASIAIYAPPERTKALKALDFRGGDCKIPDYVPDDVSSCTTIYWNLESMIRNIADLADDVTDSPGAFQETIEDLDTELKVNLQNEFFPKLSDHLTSFSQSTADGSSERTVVAIAIRDPIQNENAVASMLYNLMVEDTETRRIRVAGQKHDMWVSRLTVGEDGASFSGASMIVADGRLWLSTHSEAIEDLFRKRATAPLNKSEMYQKFEESWREFSKGELIGRSYIRGDRGLRHSYETLRRGGVAALADAEGVYAAMLYKLLRNSKTKTDFSKLPKFDEIKDSFGIMGVVGKSLDTGWQIFVGGNWL